MLPPIDVTPVEAAAVLESVASGDRVRQALPRGHVEIATGGRRLARLAWEGDGHRVVALRCYRPVHGVLPAWRELADKLAAVTGKRADPRECETCRGTGWLPATSAEVRTVALTALMVGVYRGAPVRPADGLEGRLGADLRRVAAATLAVGGRTV